MNSFYSTVVRPWLFGFDSETIHERTLDGLERLAHSPTLTEAVASFFQAERLPTRRFGLQFPNPVGLAAGMDKLGRAVPAWSALGFGFIELGGVTRHPQPGNPAPRLFRVIPEEALINRMGFNNAGADAMAVRLAEWKRNGRWPRVPVGMNLGKSKITPNENAAEDYSYSLRALWPHVDFFVVNVSSPNTPNLRELQDRSALDELLAALQETNVQTARSHKSPPRPLLVKVAPDLTLEALDDILSLVAPHQLAGIVATNTTLGRPDSDHPSVSRTLTEPGGLSGRPLRRRSTEVIAHLYKHSQGRVRLIGVGGIHDAQDAWEKITAGASLLQIYTGLVYRGPGLPRQIVAGLVQRLADHGLHNLDQAVGIAHR